MTLALAACGGGGGGGGAGGGGSSPSTPTVPTDVSVAVNQGFPPLQGVFVIGQPTSQVQLNGLVQGNGAALQGKTIYAVVEDPDGQTTGVPTVTVDPTGTAFTVNLTLKTDQPEGSRSGNFRLSACLDKACAAQLKGSPLSFSYKFKWTRQLAVNPAQITATRVYGSESPVQVDFQVLSASDATVSAYFDLYADPNHPGSMIPDPRFTVTVPSAAGSSSRTGNVQFMPALPGTYTATFYVSSSEPTAVDGMTAPQNTSATVIYEVKDDPSVAMAFSPARTEVTIKTGTTQAVHQVAGLVRPGDTFVFKSIQYGSTPSAAAGLARATQWLSSGQPHGTEWSVQTASMECSISMQAECLPTGTYTATVVLEVHRANGVVVDVNYPVTMVITN